MENKYPSPVIEKYELKICSIINQITELEKMVESKKGVKKFSKINPDKLINAVLKLQKAKAELYQAIRLLLESGGINK